MRTLYFHPVNDFSGSTTAFANMLEHINQGETVDIVTSGQGRLSMLPFVNIIEIPKLKGNRIWGLSYMSKLLGMMFIAYKLRKCYDVFYLNTIMVYPIALCNMIFRKELIWHIHEKFSYSGNIQFRLEQNIFERIFKNTKCKRIFVSDYVRRQYTHRDDCPVEIKYNYLSKAFSRSVTLKPISERKLDTCILIASLTKAKGIITLLEVAAKMPSYRFMMVLSAEQKAIDAFFYSYTIPENVIIYPSQKDVGHLLNKSDILLNLTIPFFGIETFGMTIIEGFAYGLPAIVPDVGGPTEIVESDYNGFTIDVTNVDKICSTIKYALEPTNYIKLSNNALKESKKYT